METKEMYKIAILEDDKFYNKVISKLISTLCNTRIYSTKKFNVRSYLSPYNFLEDLEQDLDLLLLDYNLFDETESVQIHGGEIVKIIQMFCPKCKVVMLTGQHDPWVAIELKNQGVHEYIDKSYTSVNRLGLVVQNMISA